MRKVKLSSYCAVKNGYAFKSNDYVSSGYRVMRITNVQKGTIVDYDPKFISNKIADDKSNFKLKAGDILVSLTGNVGRVGRIQKIHLPAVLNQRVGLIRPLSREIDDEFIFQYLNSDYFEAEAIKNANGVAQLNLSSKWLENHLIPFLPLNDQIRIAHLLGKVEGLIANRKQHLQQLDELLKSVFWEMFGDPVRNEKGWTTESCEKVVLDISSGTSYGGEDRAFETSDEIGVLKISAVTKGTFDPTEFKVVNPAQITKVLRFVKRGDFLFSRANTVELVAACCIVPQDYERLFLPDKLWVLTFNVELVNPQFFNYLLKNKRYRDVVRSLANGGHDSMLNISMKNFMTLDIPCPPVDLQNQFAIIVEKVESIKTRYQQSLTDLETLYGALSQKAFKGELDLSRVPLPSIEPEEEKTALVQVMPDPPQEECEFGLPDIDNLPTALDNAEVRKAVLIQWLKAYCDQLGSTPFSLQHWMDAVQTRLTDTLRVVIEDESTAEEDKVRLNELYPSDEVKLDANDYDNIKAWVFKGLKEGTLTQALDDTGHCVQLEPEAVPA